MAYEGQAGAAKSDSQEPRLQFVAREIASDAHRLAARLDALLDRLRQTPPRAVEDRKIGPAPDTLESAFQHTNTGLTRAREAMDEIESLI
jgi:hypothetical protein